MPDATEQEVDSVVVPILQPVVLSWLSHIATAIAAGTTMTFAFQPADATRIIIDVVALGFAGWHLWQIRSQKEANAKAAFVQGAASVGVVVPAPKVVSGDVPIIPPTAPMTDGLLASTPVSRGSQGFLGVPETRPFSVSTTPENEIVIDPSVNPPPKNP
jgi:hypothetical protein